MMRTFTNDNQTIQKQVPSLKVSMVGIMVLVLLIISQVAFGRSNKYKALSPESAYSKARMMDTKSTPFNKQINRFGYTFQVEGELVGHKNEYNVVNYNTNGKVLLLGGKKRKVVGNVNSANIVGKSISNNLDYTPDVIYQANYLGYTFSFK